MARVLVVHSDSDSRDLIAGWINDACDNTIVDTVGNEEGAKKRLRHQSSFRDLYDLIVTAVSIPVSRREMRNDAAERGIELLRSLPRLGHARKPGILIAHAIDFDLQMKTHGIDQIFLATDGTDLERQITGYAKRLVCQIDAEPQAMLARVTLTLDLTNHRWDYTIKGVGFEFSYGPQPLKIDERTMEELIKRSQRPLRNDEFWEEDVREIGRDLARHIFTNNLTFFSLVTEAATMAGGSAHKAICFNIEEKVHPVMLEALTPPEETDFWMLEVPIYRRLIATGQEPMVKRPLFDGNNNQEPFRALIIEADVAGYFSLGGEPLQFESLENVADEAGWLETKFKECGATRVDRLSLETLPAGTSFKEQLHTLLTDPESAPDIVHYCGHSYYDGASHKGYLFLPGQRIDALELELFGAWLTRTRFLYVSGCQSSQQGFAFQLARHQIPVVLGFQWPIDDDAAFEFAKEYYTSLFAGESAYCFDRAFLSARCAMQAKDRKNKIWAAPILILQDSD
jgi:CheY-like chemotaxis protein